MNCPALVNSIGLLLDIIGVILLFCYGLPPDVDRRGRQFLTWEKDEEQARKGKRFDRTSRLTPGLLIWGSRSRSPATGSTPLFSHASLLVGSLVRQQVNQPALVSLKGESRFSPAAFKKQFQHFSEQLLNLVVFLSRQKVPSLGGSRRRIKKHLGSRVR